MAKIDSPGRSIGDAQLFPKWKELMAGHKNCQQYKVRYSIQYEPEGACSHELMKGEGGTDVLAVASMLFREDGSLSVLLTGLDGRTGGDISDKDWFRVFGALAKQLSESKEFGDCSWQRDLAEQTFQNIKTFILAVTISEIKGKRKK